MPPKSLRPRKVQTLSASAPLQVVDVPTFEHPRFQSPVIQTAPMDFMHSGWLAIHAIPKPQFPSWISTVTCCGREALARPGRRLIVIDEYGSARGGGSLTRLPRRQSKYIHVKDTQALLAHRAEIAIAQRDTFVEIQLEQPSAFRSREIARQDSDH